MPLDPRHVISFALALAPAVGALASPGDPTDPGAPATETAEPRPEASAEALAGLRYGPASVQVIDTKHVFRKFTVNCVGTELQVTTPVFEGNLAAAPQVANNDLCLLTLQGAAIEYTTPIEPYQELICRPRQYPDRLQCWERESE